MSSRSASSGTGGAFGRLQQTGYDHEIRIAAALSGLRNGLENGH